MGLRFERPMLPGAARLLLILCSLRAVGAQVAASYVSGDRRSVVTVSTYASDYPSRWTDSGGNTQVRKWPASFAWVSALRRLVLQNLVDGNTASDVGYFGNFVNGNYIQFTFASAQNVQAVRIYAQHAFGRPGYNEDATFKLQGVSSLGYVTDIGPAFTVPTAYYTQQFYIYTATYTTYRFTKVSGTGAPESLVVICCAHS
jgi:hypothetical protein